MTKIYVKGKIHIKNRKVLSQQKDTRSSRAASRRVLYSLLSLSMRHPETCTGNQSKIDLDIPLCTLDTNLS